MEIPPSSTREEAAEEDFGAAKAPSVVVGILRNVWAKRGFLGKATFGGLAAGALVALLIPSRYQSTARLMPPASQANARLGILAALTAKTGTGVGNAATHLLTVHASAAAFP